MITLIQGDCLEELAKLAPESVDAVVTDPPAGISFMGHDWDGDKGGRDGWVGWLTRVMRECLRVLKPGGHSLVWALPRTSHWTATAVEDAGFEIRDVVTHLFGTGFPKSLDVGKAIDKQLGAEREVIGPNPNGRPNMVRVEASVLQPRVDAPLTAPATPEAKQWQGWGTALKPAGEHWILARKPLVGTVAANVLQFGTGGINVEGCRTDTQPRLTGTVNPHAISGTGNAYGQDLRTDRQQRYDANPPSGRWPANVVLSGDAVDEVDRQRCECLHG